MRCVVALLALSVVAACDDDGRGPAHDGGIALDARTDGPMPRRDAGLDSSKHDAADLDAVRIDAEVRDARAEPVDSTRNDGPPARDAVPDAQVDAARDAGPDATPDAEPPWVPPGDCVGIAVPPVPDSPDGQEVCNYRDDDADGLVDEGLQYEFLAEPLRITPDPQGAAGEYQLAWSGDGYGVAWQANGAANFMRLDEHGCPAWRRQVIDPGSSIVYSASHAMRYSGEHFAVVFSQDRPEGRPGAGTIATYLQLFDRAGRRAGRAIDIAPGEHHAGFNAIAAVEGNFGVFSLAYDPVTGRPDRGLFAIVDAVGNMVLPPTVVFRGDPALGVNLTELIGLEYDGEGMGLAWSSASFDFGGTAVLFMRWDLDGRVIVDPVRIAPGFTTHRRTDIAYIDGMFVVPFEPDDNSSQIAFVTPDGHVVRTVIIDEPTPDRPYSSPFQIAALDSGLLVHGSFSFWGTLLRLSSAGVPIAPETDGPPEVVEFAVPTHFPIGAISARGAGAGAERFYFNLVGCRQE